MAQISFAILVTHLQTILMRAETAIAKYTLIDLILAEAAAVIAAPGVLVIGKRVRGVAVERVPLRLCVLL